MNQNFPSIPRRLAGVIAIGLALWGFYLSDHPGPANPTFGYWMQYLFLFASCLTIVEMVIFDVRVFPFDAIAVFFLILWGVAWLFGFRTGEIEYGYGGVFAWAVLQVTMIADTIIIWVVPMLRKYVVGNWNE